MPEILYNVTVNIDDEVADDWLSWMRQTHIPEVLKTGLFTSHRLCRIMSDEDLGGQTFAIQYVCPDMASYDQYVEIFAPALQADHVARYKDRFVAIRTLLEVIE